MDIKELVKEVFTENKSYVDRYKESKNQRYLDYLTSQLLVKTDGELNLEQCEEIIKENIDNLDVEWPIVLELTHREDQEVIAEQLWSKLKKQNVVLDEDDFPDRYYPPEISVIYKIYENGNVEIENMKEL